MAGVAGLADGIRNMGLEGIPQASLETASAEVGCYTEVALAHKARRAKACPWENIAGRQRIARGASANSRIGHRRAAIDDGAS